jgi:hypothetical protein
MLSLALLARTVAGQDNPRNQSPKSPLSFIEPGQDYIIRFAMANHPYQGREDVTADFQEVNKDPNSVRIRSASINYVVEVFTVVEAGGGSWFLVEHPKSYKDSFKWNGKRYAMAALSPQTIQTLETTDEGRKRLDGLREKATQIVETDRSWVNLDHAIMIAKPPTTPIDWKLTISTKVE